MGVSTRTASRSPEISVDEIGGHGRAVSPGATSGAIAGMLGAKNTSHVSDVFFIARPELAALLSDCPDIERSSPSPIDQGEVVTRPIPRASDRNSRLEGIVAFSDRMFFSYCSDLGSSAVNEQFDSRDETGVVRREKHSHLRNFLRFSHASHRDG